MTLSIRLLALLALLAGCPGDDADKPQDSDSFRETDERDPPAVETDESDPPVEETDETDTDSDPPVGETDTDSDPPVEETDETDTDSDPPVEETDETDTDSDPPVEETDETDTDSDPPVEETDETDTDPADTDVPDTDHTDTDVADACADWWPGADVDTDGTVDLWHRVRVRVVAGDRSLVQPPVTVDVDLSADPALDPATVRVVLPGCGVASDVELPAQFVDRLVALDRRAEHLSPEADGVGLVAFILDLDGDAGTLDPLPAGDAVEVHLYFGEGDAPLAAPPVTDLVVTGTTLESGGSVATIDPDRGGLLASVTLDASPTLTSQTASCCGNSMFFEGNLTGWIPPSIEPADVQVLADGPLLGALYATGTREFEDPPGTVAGGYTYQALYWKWAGRPEVFHAAHQITTVDSVVNHPNGQWRAFRPWQATHPELAGGGTLLHFEDIDGKWTSVVGPTWGYTLGLPVPPANLDDLANPLVSFTGVPNPDFLVVFGNDLDKPYLPTPATLPAGTAYFDHLALFVRPFASPLGAAEEAAVEDLLAPPSAVVIGTDALP